MQLDVTYNDMKETVDRELEAAKGLVKLFNSLEDETQRDILMKSFNNKYIAAKNGRFVFYDTLPKLELYNYTVNQVVYKNGLSVKMAYDGIGALSSSAEFSRETGNLESIAKATKKLSFKDAYLKALDAKRKLDPFTLDRYCSEELVRDAVYKLTPEEVKSVRYRRFQSFRKVLGYRLGIGG